MNLAWRWCLLALPLALAATVPLAGCDRKPAEPPPVLRPVLSLVVRRAPPVSQTRFTGTVQPRYQVQMGFQTDGRITSRQVDVGDRVTQGQQLATLDPTLARLAIITAQSALRDAQATLTNAVAENGRQQALIRTNVVSQSQVDAAVAARDTAQARVSQAEASLQKAQEQFRYTALTSQYDGVVAAWSAEVGQVVTSGQGVVTVVRDDSRDAVFDLSGAALEAMRPGARFVTSLIADPAVHANAVVREISPQFDAATRSQRVRLTLEAPPDAFRLGATISLVQDVGGVADIRIPLTAVLDVNGQTRVWLVSPKGEITARAVQLGARTADTVVVTGGLQPGERIARAGVHSLSEEQAVKPPSQQDSPT